MVNYIAAGLEKQLSRLCARDFRDGDSSSSKSKDLMTGDIRKEGEVSSGLFQVAALLDLAFRTRRE